ncbi:MAG: UvrD-helicase domain-containing protein [Muribaculum sp.]|nr:UvrD-helicase domain-containing protein [Muribaculaceae bacterium]MCM1080305.1 UvrD-helicase domain-containing protein [Muribaculum sp.]
MLTIHKASAGSGKTYTLTKIYLKLLLGQKKEGSTEYSLANPDERNRHRSILAITFTNKATEEMKQRIVARLAELAENRKCQFLDYLCSELHCSEAQVRERARRALSDLLSDFGQFNVSTIDSFFQTVLRTFAREVNLQGGYEIELDEDHATFVGVSQMLASINRTDDGDPLERRHVAMLSTWLEAYMNYRIANGKQFNLFVRHSNLNGDMVSFVKNSMNETYKLNNKLITDYMADFGRLMRFSGALSQTIAIRSSRLKAIGTDVLSIIQQNDWSEKLYSYISGDAAKWAAKVYSITDSTTKAASDIEKRFKKNFRSEAGSADDSILTTLIAEATTLVAQLNFYSYILDHLYYLGLIGEAERFSQQYLRENNAILLSSTNEILRAIINDEEMPFIYERMGVRLRHFLIDEFQDTSRMQWLNLKPLVKESLATDADNLIIGDEKQAIYRFRNSDPDLIAIDVPRDFNRQSQIKGADIKENTNWRSSGTIVQFNNTIFTVLASMLNATGIYKNVAQQIKYKDLPGYVELHPYNADSEEPLAHMTQEIVRQLKAGYRQKDIAILVNRGAEGVVVVDYLLKAASEYPELASLKIITEEALKISASEVVDRIISVMRYVDAHLTVDHRKNSKLAAYELIAIISNRFQLLLSQGMSKADALTAAFETTDDSAESLAIEAATMKCFNLSSAVERIITRFVTDWEHRHHNIYLSALLDMVSDYSAHNAASLHSFLQWWDETGSGLSIAVPSNTDAVTVMTIHKSKGLEYPCVHIPFAEWRMKKLSRINWFETNTQATGGAISEFSTPDFDPDDVPPLIPMEPTQRFEGTSLEPQLARIAQEDIVDNLNKTYVAFTRASRELIVSYKYNPPKNKKSETIPHVGLLLNAAIRRANAAYVQTVTATEQLADGMLTELSSGIDEQNIFILGQPTTPKVDDEVEESRLQTKAVAMEPFYSSDNDSIWQMNSIEDIDKMEPRQRGIILHNIMSRIRHRSDIRRSVNKAVSDGDITAQEGDDVASRLEKALSHDKARGWFDNYVKLLNERGLNAYSKKKEKICHYRTDRVVWCDDGTICVVDYKFGDEEPESYKTKVRFYMNVIQRLYPECVVKGCIWWPFKDKFYDINPDDRK